LHSEVHLAQRNAMTDSYNLQRFIDAQNPIYASALSEIRSGNKRGHWMWFIFPQMRGLGHSDMAQFYGIRSMEEAKAYLDHPVLGARLRECVAAMQDLSGTTPKKVFGEIDAIKFRSCLTLFERAGGDLVFEAALNRWFAGERDEATLRILEVEPPSED
jgi:uncharacterized protein (DUF1810 family)